MLANAVGVFVRSGTALENLIAGNTGVGLFNYSFTPATGFAGNVISQNSGGTFTGPLVATGPNACNGAPC